MTKNNETKNSPKQEVWVLMILDDNTHETITSVHKSKQGCIKKVEEQLDDCKKGNWDNIKERLQKYDYYYDEEAEESYEIKKCEVCEEPQRTDSEILKDLIDAVVEYNADRDGEWDFQDNHGADPAYWTQEDEEEHSDILADIKNDRERIRKLIVEATGDEYISF